ncbi:hotdog fold thioesterase [Legionella sp. CNM-1927-20]|uniref:hotdog fold thioesterase n=1 Tax=Legionella sp. CNM-1927-20 TaxID=3422221 RepID=UPI00403AC56D
MAIWFQPLTIEYINKRNQNTLADFLGIEFIEIGDDFLTATMPASERTKQPLGIIHGGANVVLAETLASVAANSVVDLSKFYCVGLEINANHIRPVSKGSVKGITHPIHIGRTTHVWQIDMYNEEGKKSCVSRMTASVVAR